MPPILYIIIFVILVIIFYAAYLQNKRNRILSVRKLEELKKKDDTASKEELEGLCPVCGFNVLKQLKVKPWEGDIPSDKICPGCGILYGYDDAAGGDKIKREEIYIVLREKFLKKGKNYENLLRKTKEQMEGNRKS